MQRSSKKLVLFILTLFISSLLACGQKSESDLNALGQDPGTNPIQQEDPPFPFYDKVEFPIEVEQKVSADQLILKFTNNSSETLSFELRQITIGSNRSFNEGSKTLELEPSQSTEIEVAMATIKPTLLFQLLLVSEGELLSRPIFLKEHP